MEFSSTKNSDVAPYSPLAEEGTISPVVYKEGKFQLEEGDLYDCLRWHEMEVVGNIYDNPELL
jgi:YopX protein